MTARGRAVAAVCLSCVASCAYLHDRANDLLDPFRFDVGFLPGGVFLEARATDFLEVGAGVHSLYTVGVHGRFVGSGQLGQGGLPGLCTVGEANMKMEPLLGDASQFHEKRDLVPGQLLLMIPGMHSGRTGYSEWSLGERGVHVADVGVTATVLLPGISIGFSPGELLDLFLGLFGIDIAGDDVARIPRPEKPEVLPSYTLGSPRPLRCTACH